jgi:hypothetical protein
VTTRGCAATFWLVVAVVVVAGLLLLALAGCQPHSGVNHGPTPPGHTTTVGPRPSATHNPNPTRQAGVHPYTYPTNQAQVDKLAKLHPTVLCADGYLGWPAHRQGACSHHGGIGEWYG